jgi:DNA-binding NarL/FixJ family response regulator
MQDSQVGRARARDDDRPLPRPAGAVADIRRPAISAAQRPIIALSPPARLLILVERRNFVRCCIACWFDNSCAELATLAVTDVETSLDDAALAQATAVLIGAGAPGWTDGWLCRQIEWLRERRMKLPIVMIVDVAGADERMAVETLAARLGIQGYIPTSSSVDVAVAALRLVMVGGRYFPTIWEEEQSPALISTGRTPSARVHGGPAKLTPREVAILSVLGQGASNKIIAYQLGIALSTVKVHVHNIIRKLNVRNRTEAVVVARAMQQRVAHTNGLTEVESSMAHDMRRPTMPALTNARLCGDAALTPNDPALFDA